MVQSRLRCTSWGRGTVLLIVYCRCNQFMGNNQTIFLRFCCVQKCELSNIYPGHDVKLHPHRVKFVSNRVCGIWRGIGKGPNVIISKSYDQIAGCCVYVTRVFYCELCCIVIMQCLLICVVSCWPSLADWAGFPPLQLSVLTCRNKNQLIEWDATFYRVEE